MNDVTVNELIAIGFKNAYSAYHDDRYIYNLKKDGMEIQWDSMFENEIILSQEKAETGTAITIKGIDHLKRIVSALFNKEPEVQGCDTTDGDSSNADGEIKKLLEENKRLKGIIADIWHEKAEWMRIEESNKPGFWQQFKTENNL